MCSLTTFAQKEQARDKLSPQQKLEMIKSSDNKLPYLETFLNDVKNNPLKFSASTKEARDSVAANMQIDYNLLLLTIFKGSDKNTMKIKKSTSKAYNSSIRILYGGDELTKEKQDYIDQSVSETQELIKKYNFLK